MDLRSGVDRMRAGLETMLRSSAVAAIACLLASVFVMGAFVREPGLDSNWRATVPEMVYGSAHRPFVTRALLPLATRGLVAAIPEPLAAAFWARAASPGIQSWVMRLGWDPRFLLEYAVLIGLAYACLLGFALALHALRCATLETPSPFADWIPAFALLGIPPFFTYTNYASDFATLLFFAAALLAMARGRFGLYLAVLLPAALNRETAILLPLVFALHFARGRRMPGARYVRLLAAQLAIVIGVRAAVAFAYRGNPGSTLELHALGHNFDLIRTYTFAQLLALALPAFFVARGWREKSPLLRSAMWMLPVLAVLAWIVGFADERRVFFEAYPAAFLLGMHGVARGLGLPARAPDAEPAP